MTEIYLDQNWQEIQPQRSVTADTFAQGSILFNFNVSGLNSVSLKDSYFLIKSSLVRGAGGALEVKDRTTLHTTGQVPCSPTSAFVCQVRRYRRVINIIT